MATLEQITRFTTDYGRMRLLTPRWIDIKYEAIQTYSVDPESTIAFSAKIYSERVGNEYYARFDVSTEWGDAQPVLNAMRLDYDAAEDSLKGGPAVLTSGSGWVLHELRVYRLRNGDLLDQLQWAHPRKGRYVTTYVWPPH